MKYIKHTALLGMAIATVLLSVKSSYAENEAIVNINPTSSKTIELEINPLPDFMEGTLESDLRIYQDLTILSLEVDKSDSRKAVIMLDKELSDGGKYSLLSIVGAEGDMEFAYKEDQEKGVFMNKSFEGLDQGIVKLQIMNDIVEVFFSNDIAEEELDFKFYQNIDIAHLEGEIDTSTVELLLKDELINESMYVATTTYFAAEDGKKIEIESGIYDFTTLKLEEYNPAQKTSDTIISIESDEHDFGDSLSDILDKSGIMEEGGEMLDGALESIKGGDAGKLAKKGGDLLKSTMENLSQRELLESELEAMAVLNAAADDENNEPTQLENLALSRSETPDTGAATWVLLLGTFIINTFYYCSRRKSTKIS